MRNAVRRRSVTLSIQSKPSRVRWQNQEQGLGGTRVGKIQWIGGEQGAEGDINQSLSNQIGLGGIRSLKHTLEDVHNLDYLEGFRIGGAKPVRNVTVPRGSEGYYNETYVG
jgi:hypothetical protein